MASFSGLRLCAYKAYEIMQGMDAYPNGELSISRAASTFGIVPVLLQLAAVQTLAYARNRLFLPERGSPRSLDRPRYGRRRFTPEHRFQSNPLERRWPPEGSGSFGDLGVIERTRSSSPMVRRRKCSVRQPWWLNRCAASVRGPIFSQITRWFLRALKHPSLHARNWLLPYFQRTA